MVAFTPTAAWNREFNSNSGQVGRYLKKVARQTRNGAQRRVGVDSGALKGSIEVALEGRDRLGPAIAVEARQPYAAAHHEGSSPHPIHGDPLLVFPSRGRVVFTSKVDHPGSQANPFLWDALVEVVGGRVVTPHQSRAG